ncbi:MAG: hypothetical protein QNK20_01770 [Aureibaculum sp.]|nr:hypothetical protein [Aureibaculum sp.]
METSTIIIISWGAIISLLILIKNNRLYKEINHQKALVSVLRNRLGDKQDKSNPFTLDELKEINVWSGKAVNNVYKESIPKDYPEYAKQVREANISGMSPTVDNTTTERDLYKYNRLIKTDKEYEDSLIRINELMDAKANTPECDELELLGILVNHYEEQELRECRRIN